MKNFIQPGKILTLVAPKDYHSGDVAIVGSIIGVVDASAKVGEPLVLSVVGVYRLSKVAELIEQGAKVYFKEGAGITKVADGAHLIGVSVEDAAASDTEISVRLNGSF